MKTRKQAKRSTGKQIAGTHQGNSSCSRKRHAVASDLKDTPEKIGWASVEVARVLDHITPGRLFELIQERIGKPELAALHNLQAAAQIALREVSHQKICARQLHDAAECTCIRADVAALEAKLAEHLDS